jgi:iron complex outermembrane recepter protein
MFGKSYLPPALAAACLSITGAPALAQQTEAAATPARSQSDALQEVIVTAQKREEGLQIVPIPVSVISGATLTNSNQVKLADFYDQVPGLNMAPGGESSQTLSIRGITTGAIAQGPPSAGPTVAIAVDGVPYGGSGGGDTAVPDFDPGDLARVEVLRGPQGTLYGASSLGGMLNFVTIAPSTDRVSGRLEAGTNSVYNGAQQGYSVRGSVNLPVTDDFAVRASAFTRLDPGYIDNPVRGTTGVNKARASGGHLAALWKPTDTLSVQVSALFQQIKGDGTNDVTPHPPQIGTPPIFPANLGDLQQTYIPGVGPYHRESQAYSAVITDQIGSVTVTSLTGYNRYAVRDSLDATEYPFEYEASFDTFGVYGQPQYETINIGRYSEELRLSAPLGPHVDLLFGGFFSHETDRFRWDEYAADPHTGAIAGYWGSYNLYNAPITYSEYAAFTDLTFRISDQFDVQLGARESFDRITAESWVYNLGVATYWTGPPICSEEAPICVAFPSYVIKQNAPTYLFTPRYKFSRDLMVYARVATGFRQGGSNAGAAGAPLAYSPDKTTNYELGLKGDFLDHTLSVDGSVYYIDWKHIQVVLSDYLGFSYVGNGGAAKSQGVELTVQAKPVRGLTVGGWVDFSQAKLTDDVPSINGKSGDILPNTPRFSANFSLNQEFPLGQSVTGFVGGTLAYVGSRLDSFSTLGPRLQLPAYAKTNLNAGAKFDDWSVNLYVNNVADKRGLISGSSANGVPFAFFPIQPRTVGLSVARSF